MRNQILTINCGSSSLKVSLFNKDQTQCHLLLNAHLKEFHTENCRLVVTAKKESKNLPIDISVGILEGLQLIFNYFIDTKYLVISSLQGIGHRFVHGGNKFISSTLLNQAIISELEGLSYLAPLHNQACLLGIRTCFDYFGDLIPQIAVFDTAFHSTLPPIAANYAIDSCTSMKYNIKRYGFHGISNAFLWDVYKKHLRKPLEKSKVIMMHLGNGCSMTAIKGGISIDTSMGFTPSEGLVMATRAGDVDVGVVDFLCTQESKTVDEVMELLNSHSGLLGISEISSDMEILLSHYKENEKIQLAIEIFCYRILKYLGAYIAILGGVDAILFSGGIGENSPIIRKFIIEKMQWYGIEIDHEKNESAIKLPSGAIQCISSKSAVALYVVATDENQFIAKEVLQLLFDSSLTGRS